MRWSTPVLVVAMASYTGAANAEDPFSRFSPDQRDSLSSAYGRCAAYFTYVWKGLARSGKADIAEKSQSLAKAAMSTSYELAAASRSSEMAFKVAEARYELYLDSMSKEIGQDFGNMSILIKKYQTSCLSALREPSTFSLEYLSRAKEKP